MDEVEIDVEVEVDDVLVLVLEDVEVVVATLSSKKVIVMAVMVVVVPPDHVPVAAVGAVEETFFCTTVKQHWSVVKSSYNSEFELVAVEVPLTLVLSVEAPITHSLAWLRVPVLPDVQLSEPTVAARAVQSSGVEEMRTPVCFTATPKRLGEMPDQVIVMVSPICRAVVIMA